MTEIVIESGNAEHLDAVMAIMRAAFDPRYGEAWTASQTLGLLTMPGVSLRLARRRRPLLGFALSRTILDECELMLLAVAPNARRLGTGGALVDDTVRNATVSGVRTLHLEVRKGNPATELYCSRGFKFVGARSRYYKGSHGELYDAETYRRVLI